MVDWQSESDLDSIRNSCDVSYKVWGVFFLYVWIYFTNEFKKRSPAMHHRLRCSIANMLFLAGLVLQWRTKNDKSKVCPPTPHFWTKQPSEDNQTTSWTVEQSVTKQRIGLLFISISMKKIFEIHKAKAGVPHMLQKQLEDFNWLKSVVIDCNHFFAKKDSHIAPWF